MAAVNAASESRLTVADHPLIQDMLTLKDFLQQAENAPLERCFWKILSNLL
jgi:hypothetical protein